MTQLTALVQRLIAAFDSMTDFLGRIDGWLVGVPEPRQRQK